ncbi:MAG: hypothetical protein NTW49_05465 [Bacteroidia bacterium]|nr:hypothetical protein [Bacteroidia bacterium]
MPGNLKDNIRLGFIGGCINFPKGIDTNFSYHRLLKQSCQEAEIHLAKYEAYSQLIQSSKQFIEKNNLDIFFVFVRHFPYMVLNKPLIRKVNQNLKSEHCLHPALINRKLKNWPVRLDKFIGLNGDQPVPHRKRFGLRDINSMIGKILGLHQWAIRYVSGLLTELKVICNELHCKLVVIGPVKNPETYMGNIISTNLNNKLVKFTNLHHINFIDINILKDSKRNNIFQEDKIHLNQYGHNLLYEKIKDHLIAYWNKE